MEINRLVTAELGMQVRVSLTGKSAFASVLHILWVPANDATTYSPFVRRCEKTAGNDCTVYGTLIPLFQED